MKTWDSRTVCDNTALQGFLQYRFYSYTVWIETSTLILYKYSTVQYVVNGVLLS